MRFDSDRGRPCGPSPGGAPAASSWKCVVARTVPWPPHKSVPELLNSSGTGSADSRPRAY